MKILMSAFACEPGLGSEPELGWHWAEQASRFHDVWVLTHASHREGIERELIRRPNPRLRFAYVDAPAWTNATGFRGLVLRAQYLRWQLTASRVAKRLHADIGFDAAHHVTYCSIRYPTFVAWLGIPFVWGPLGGGERAPASFYTGYGWRGALYESLRDANNLSVKVNPLVHFTSRRASRIIAVTPETARLFPESHQNKVLVRQAIGIELEEIPETLLKEPAKPPLRLMYAGLLLHRKGVHLLLPAIKAAMDQGVSITLDVYGGGPMESRLKAVSSELGLEHVVDFRGRVAREELLTSYRQYDVFVFPSLQDSGGFVALEAMAAGLPVICLDLGGPAQLVTDKTGIRIPAIDSNQVIRDLATAIASLATDSDRMASMSKEAPLHVHSHYTWDAIGAILQDVYTQIA